MAKRRGSSSRSRSSSKSILGMNNCLLVGLCLSVVVGVVYFFQRNSMFKEGNLNGNSYDDESNSKIQKDKKSDKRRIPWNKDGFWELTPIEPAQ